MPIVLRVKGYRFGFYASDADEPPHVHVNKNGKCAKYWLVPVSLQSSKGFAAHELNEAERIVVRNLIALLESWNAFFNR